MTNKPICKAPFIALRYSADGYMVPCCWMKTIPYLKKNSTSIESYWENKTIKKIRQQMLNGVLPDGCKRCTNVDDTINYSRIEFYLFSRLSIEHMILFPTRSKIYYYKT